MDRLPSAMAASLSGIIRYNAPVVRVERQSTGFWMEAALQSGERAAREVLSATGRPWPEQTGPTR